MLIYIYTSDYRRLYLERCFRVVRIDTNIYAYRGTNKSRYKVRHKRRESQLLMNKLMPFV